jgi:hypothetical protein
MRTYDPEIETLLLHVAEKLGWRELSYNRQGVLVGMVPGKRIIRPLPEYTSNLSQAWTDITSLLTPIGMNVQLTYQHLGGGMYLLAAEITLRHHESWRAVHRHPATALCMALQAVPAIFIDGNTQDYGPNVLGHSVPK